MFKHYVMYTRSHEICLTILFGGRRLMLLLWWWDFEAKARQSTVC